MYEAPYLIPLNPTMWSQTKTSIAKLACINKRETAQLKLTDTIFFFGTLSLVLCFKEAGRFGSRVCFRFQAKKHLTWWSP
jgi:hypothetical protein